MAELRLHINPDYRNIDHIIALASIITEAESHSQVEVAVCKAEYQAAFAQLIKRLPFTVSSGDLALLALREVLESMPVVDVPAEWVV